MQTVPSAANPVLYLLIYQSKIKVLAELAASRLALHSFKASINAVSPTKP